MYCTYTHVLFSCIAVHMYCTLAHVLYSVILFTKNCGLHVQKSVKLFVNECKVEYCGTTTDRK